MSRDQENEAAAPTPTPAPVGDGAEEAPEGMSGMDTGTAPWGVSGEGDARHGDAADAGGEGDRDDPDGR